MDCGRREKDTGIASLPPFAWVRGFVLPPLSPRHDDLSYSMVNSFDRSFATYAPSASVGMRLDRPIFTDSISPEVTKPQTMVLPKPSRSAACSTLRSSRFSNAMLSRI